MISVRVFRPFLGSSVAYLTIWGASDIYLKRDADAFERHSGHVSFESSARARIK